MIWSRALVSRKSANFAVALLLAGAQVAEAASSHEKWAAAFSDGLQRLGLLFSGIGALGSGPSSGEIWAYDRKTGQRRRIGSASDLAWPVLSPDDRFLYALRGRQAVRVALSDGRETAVGEPADWIKLLGVDPESGILLGFVADGPEARSALLRQDGERIDLPAPAADAAQKRTGVLLQEARSYADGIRFEVRNSQRGGRGRDVFLTQGTSAQNMSDCGDNVCGQPSRSTDGTLVVYVRGDQF